MRSILLIGTTIILASSTSWADKKPADKGPDKAAAELKAIHEKMNQAWLTGDAATFASNISDTPWVSWDTGEAGRPIEQTTKAQAVKMFEDMQKMVKMMGAK